MWKDLRVPFPKRFPVNWRRCAVRRLEEIVFIVFWPGKNRPILRDALMQASAHFCCIAIRKATINAGLDPHKLPVRNSLLAHRYKGPQKFSSTKAKKGVASRSRMGISLEIEVVLLDIGRSAPLAAFPLPTFKAKVNGPLLPAPITCIIARYSADSYPLR